MTRWGMVIDLARCIGCNACTVACQIENGSPPGVYFTRVYTEETGTFPDVETTFVPALCNHCEDAPCIPVCPTGARAGQWGLTRPGWSRSGYAGSPKRRRHVATIRLKALAGR